MESTTSYTFPMQIGGISYFHWHRHQIEGTNGFQCHIRKTQRYTISNVESQVFTPNNHAWSERDSLCVCVCTCMYVCVRVCTCACVQCVRVCLRVPQIVFVMILQQGSSLCKYYYVTTRNESTALISYRKSILECWRIRSSEHG